VHVRENALHVCGMQMWAPGTIVKDLESHVSAAWGMPHLVLEEVLVTSEGSVLRTRRTAPAQH